MCFINCSSDTGSHYLFLGCSLIKRYQEIIKVRVRIPHIGLLRASSIQMSPVVPGWLCYRDEFFGVFIWEISARLTG